MIYSVLLLVGHFATFLLKNVNRKNMNQFIAPLGTRVVQKDMIKMLYRENIYVIYQIYILFFEITSLSSNTLLMPSFLPFFNSNARLSFLISLQHASTASPHDCYWISDPWVGACVQGTARSCNELIGYSCDASSIQEIHYNVCSVRHKIFLLGLFFC